MLRIEITQGPLKGFQGDALHFPASNEYSVSIPGFQKSLHKEIYQREEIKILDEIAAPILDSNRFITLQHDEVQLTGCKVSCSSVWCRTCYTRKGGSRRFSERLAMMDWRRVRQVVCTVDRKKFDDDGQYCFEIMKEEQAIPQFIHNLRRTEGIVITDWVWCLEWHTDGFPHWHLFIETAVPGKGGMIGNKALLNQWRYGLIKESYIRDEDHWKRFTAYFGAKGYFDPKKAKEVDRKRHQLELPEWAKQVTYRIRKTGSMVRADRVVKPCEGETGFQEEKPSRPHIRRPYYEILADCGCATYCEVFRGEGVGFWRRFEVPYREFKEFAGEFIPSQGYRVQMSLKQFFTLPIRNSYQVSEAVPF